MNTRRQIVYDFLNEANLIPSTFNVKAVNATVITTHPITINAVGVSSEYFLKIIVNIKPPMLPPAPTRPEIAPETAGLTKGTIPNDEPQPAY